jgi:hypothetical protein
MDVIVKQEEKMPSLSPLNLLLKNAKAYCETTSLSGFLYWVIAPRFAENLFWVAVFLTGFSCAGLIISSAVDNWQKNPGIVTINSFSKVIGCDSNSGCHERCMYNT